MWSIKICESNKKKNLKKKKQHRTAKKMDKSSGESDNQVAKNHDDCGPADGEDAAQNNQEQMKQLQYAMKLINMNQKISPDLSSKSYQFWDTQPVPKINEECTTNEPVEADKQQDQIRQEAYTLPTGFVWDTLDLADDGGEEIRELYTLLTENYVEDDDAMFRFDYSPAFLKWALQPPGWKKVWHCGVRVEKNRKLVGFISAVPVTMNIYGVKNKSMVDINFLCVHKRLRSKRVAPVLIREITRRVNCFGIFQAVYTAGVVLPKPVSKCRYWHRSLNPRKLIEVRFSHLSRNMTMQRLLKLYKLPSETSLKGFRSTRPADIESICSQMNVYLSKFEMAPVFTVDEAMHWFLPRDGIMDSYVIETKGEITDFVSFYTLPSTVMHHPVHSHVNAAYAFYSFANSVPWTKLMQDALIIAKKNGLDVFNALNLMDNKTFLEDLKFGIGDGDLQYYLYNWKCPTMIPEKVGLVLQ